MSREKCNSFYNYDFAVSVRLILKMIVVFRECGNIILLYLHFIQVQLIDQSETHIPFITILLNNLYLVLLSTNIVKKLLCHGILSNISNHTSVARRNKILSTCYRFCFVFISLCIYDFSRSYLSRKIFVFGILHQGEFSFIRRRVFSNKKCI